MENLIGDCNLNGRGRLFGVFGESILRRYLNQILLLSSTKTSIRDSSEGIGKWDVLIPTVYISQSCISQLLYTRSEMRRKVTRSLCCAVFVIQSILYILCISIAIADRPPCVTENLSERESVHVLSIYTILHMVNGAICLPLHFWWKKNGKGKQRQWQVAAAAYK